MTAVVLVIDGASQAPWHGGALPSRSFLGIEMPALRRLARRGAVVPCRTVPSGSPTGTEAAFGELLGIPDAARGPSEALASGLHGEWAWRVNIVRAVDGALADATPRLTKDERLRAVGALLEAVAREAGALQVQALDGWRIVVATADAVSADAAWQGWPHPHQSIGRALGEQPVRTPLEHAVRNANAVLVDEGLGLWPWGGGSLSAPPLKRRHRLTIVASATAVRGLAGMAGAAVFTPPGATGDVDTDLGAKAAAVVEAAHAGVPIVLCHVDGADAAAHRRDAVGLAMFLERVDRELIRPVAAFCDQRRVHGRLAVLPDHATDAGTGRHVAGSVPLVFSRNAVPSVATLAAGDLEGWLTEQRRPAQPVPGLEAVLFDVGGTLVREAPPATAVQNLQVQVLDGVRDGVERLARHYELGAVTNTSVMRGDEVRALLDDAGLGRRLRTIVTSIDAGRPKPDPAPLQEALRRLGVPAMRACYVGDRHVDRMAADACGMRYVDAGAGFPSVVSELLKT